MYRNLHALARDPKCWVSEAFDEENNIWRLLLRWNLYDWEMEDFGQLLALIDGAKPDPLRRDSWEWVIFTKGIFTPKSLYLELGGFRASSFSVKGIWFSGIPSKVSFFMWTAFCDKILTIDHLQSMGWYMANRCVMCLREME